MKVLVVGGGGREHALCWKLAKSPRLTKLYAAPGNAGCADVAECVDLKIEQVDAIVAFANSEKIDLTIVGPEQPLSLGLVDRLERIGRRAFGPGKEAARLESSKVFAKNLMRRHNIPTAEWKMFPGAREAKVYLERAFFPLVVKADGLAAGKGVKVCKDRDEALEFVRDCMERRLFGEAGDKIIIEEALRGEEASVLVVTDGQTLLVLETAQDYKRAHDGDEGPNTGGMGSISPAPHLDDDAMKKIEQKVLIPVIHAMAREGHPFKGVLYAGLMMTPTGPRVLEFNCRFGDPETQPILLRLESDLLTMLDAAVQGKLDQVEARWDKRPAVSVVVASGGYPGSYEIGKVITGLDKIAPDPDLAVFHAGTAMRMGKLTTSGGRVFGVTAKGATFADARTKAYDAVGKIEFDGAHARSDIASGL